jgi:hypothetical protein
MQSGVVGEESDGGAEQRKQGMSGVVVLGFPVSWRSTGELRVLAAAAVFLWATSDPSLLSPLPPLLRRAGGVDRGPNPQGG